MVLPVGLEWKEIKSISGEVVVVTFDICSSSDIIEELITKGRMDKYVEFVGSIKHHLASAQRKVLFAPYKFNGDGWILIFPLKQYTGGASAITPKLLVQFLTELCSFFHAEFANQVMPHLDQPPSLIGINFGLCMGQIYQTTIFGKQEYLGRPVIVACRLQGEIKTVDESPAYKALVPMDVFQNYLSSIGNGSDETVNLRNIRGGRDFRCKKVTLFQG